MEHFARTALLFGEENMEKLKNARVAVFGIGGVGGHAAEALARGGIYNIDLFDSDTVCRTNINRQIVATEKTIGLYKVDVMRDRIMEINGGAKVCTNKIFYLPENADEVDLSCYTYIIDAIDTVSAKTELICRANVLGVPVISSMGMGNKLDPTKIEVADIYKTSVCPLARVMRQKLRACGIKKLKTVYSKEETVYVEQNEKTAGKRAPGSNSFVPSVAGIIMAGEVIKDIVKAEFKKD